MSHDLKSILTNTGLNLPEHYTEDEFFEAGRFLANIEHSLQWSIGDWYNAIPISYGNKKSACEKAGLDYKTANTYAKVAFLFESPTRVGCLSFVHYQKLAVNALDDNQRTELLQKARDNNLSCKQLVTERDFLLVTQELETRTAGETKPSSTEANSSTANEKDNDHMPDNLADETQSDSQAIYGDNPPPNSEQSDNAVPETNKALIDLKQVNQDLVLRHDTEHLKVVHLEGEIRSLKSEIETLEEAATNDKSIIIKLNDEIAKLQSSLKPVTKKPVKTKKPAHYKVGTVIEVLTRFLPDGINNTNDMRSALSDGYRTAKGISTSLKAEDAPRLNEYLKTLSADDINQLILIKKDDIRDKAKAKRLSRK